MVTTDSLTYGETAYGKKDKWDYELHGFTVSMQHRLEMISKKKPYPEWKLAALKVEALKGRVMAVTRYKEEMLDKNYRELYLADYLAAKTKEKNSGSKKI